MQVVTQLIHMLQKTKQRFVETVQRNYDGLVSRIADGLENRVTVWVLVAVLPIGGILGSIKLEQIGMQRLPLILLALTFALGWVVLDAINEFESRDNGL